MLHGAVEVAGEAVLDEQGGEVERPQHELLEVPGRLPRLVAGQHPRPSRVRGRLGVVRVILICTSDQLVIITGMEAVDQTCSSISSQRSRISIQW